MPALDLNRCLCKSTWNFGGIQYWNLTRHFPLFKLLEKYSMYFFTQDKFLPYFLARGEKHIWKCQNNTIRTLLFIPRRVRAHKPCVPIEMHNIGLPPHRELKKMHPAHPVLHLQRYFLTQNGLISTYLRTQTKNNLGTCEKCPSPQVPALASYGAGHLGFAVPHCRYNSTTTSSYFQANLTVEIANLCIDPFHPTGPLMAPK